MRTEPNLPDLDAVTKALESIKVAESYWLAVEQDTEGLGVVDDPFLDVTLAIDTTGDDPENGAIQTGDNSYHGAAYSYPDWAVGSIQADTDCKALAEVLIDQLAELFYGRVQV